MHGALLQLLPHLRSGPALCAQGCERSVITYSSLISACEKSGEWRLALRFFEECLSDGCRPNVITFNSLITACAQGACPPLHGRTPRQRPLRGGVYILGMPCLLDASSPLWEIACVDGLLWQHMHGYTPAMARPLSWLADPWHGT